MDWSEIETSRDGKRLSGEGADALRARLRSMFQLVSPGPMPDRLTELADKLEDALRRGELRRTAAS